MSKLNMTQKVSNTEEKRRRRRMVQEMKQWLQCGKDSDLARNIKIGTRKIYRFKALQLDRETTKEMYKIYNKMRNKMDSGEFIPNEIEMKIGKFIVTYQKYDVRIKKE